MKKTKENLFAFTLIELLVVVAIIGITSSIVLVEWSSGRIEKQLESSAREVEAVVREAQNFSLTGYQAVAGAGNEPCAFKVTWGGSVYSLTYFYGSGTDCDQSLVLQSHTLQNGVTFSGGANFDFQLPHGSFVGATKVITLTKSGSTHTVCVYANGLINNISGAACPVL